MGEQVIRRSATEQVYTLIIRKIQKGDFSSGDRLNIESLSKEFGVSRTPVREALGMLVQNGYLEHIHNMGPRIPEISKQQITELIETNSALLNGLIPVIFRAGITKEFLGELKAAVEMQKMALEERNQEVFTQSSIRFHERIIEECPNKKLKQISEQVWKQMDAWVSIYRGVKVSKSLSVKQHEAILEAFWEKDQEKVLQRLIINCSLPIEYLPSDGEE